MEVLPHKTFYRSSFQEMFVSLNCPKTTLKMSALPLTALFFLGFIPSRHAAELAVIQIL